MCRERFERRGRRLVFPPDEDLTGNPKGALGWIEAPIKYIGLSNGDAEVLSPAVTVQPKKCPSYDLGAGRFVGANYIKCLSPASCLEWIMIDSLKDAPKP